MKPSRIIFGLLKIPVDFLMGVLGFLAAYHIRTFTDLIPGISLPLDLGSFPNLNDYLTFSFVSVTVLVAIFAINRLYGLKSRPRFAQEIGQIVTLGAAWFMLIIGWFFVIREFPFSRLVLAYGWILTTLFVIIGRFLVHMAENISLKSGIGRTQVLFIGDNDITRKLSGIMGKNPEYHIVGCVADGENFQDMVKKHHIEKIIQTSSVRHSAADTELLEFCREHHLEYGFVPDLLSVQQSNVEVETMGGIPVIQLKPTPLDGWGRVMKRTFDLAGAGAGLVLLSPVFAVTALAIKLDSRGTVLYKYLDDGSRVKRVGQHGKLFHCFKFRTMEPNTHSLRYTELKHQNTREGSPLVKIKNDPRVTRVGRFLRRTSIDELPQLWNVLKGEMSLVGPRPHLPEEVARYEKHHRFALTIKPGITGLAQISGRSDLDFEEEVRLDTYYIEQWSLWLDIKIIVKTLGAVVRGYQE